MLVRHDTIANIRFRDVVIIDIGSRQQVSATSSFSICLINFSSVCVSGHS
jgi:hypothetical protein